MAEVNQSFHLPSPFCLPRDKEICLPKEEEISCLFQNFTLGNEKEIMPTDSFGETPSSFSYSPFSVHQDYYLQNRVPINGVNGGGLWNNGGNAVDWSSSDTSCKFISPNTLPSISNFGRVEGINFPVSYLNNYSPPTTTRFNHSVVPSYNTSSVPITTDMKKEELAKYNELQTNDFKSYLKLKGWTDEQIRYLERCDDPVYLNELDIHMMCMNQLGSMYLQRVIQTEAAVPTTIILNAVLKGVFEIMRDPNGSYVFQRLVDYCSIEQLRKIDSALTKSNASGVFISAIMTENGTKSIQRLIGKLKKHKLMKNMIKSLRPWAIELMMNPSGRHLIDNCMNALSYGQCQFIYEAVIPNCVDLARDKEGYHVVSKAIETVQDPLRTPLLTSLADNAVHLAQEPNGNFVLQKLIALENRTILSKLCTNLEGKIVLLSKNKYGSRVIEKCFESSEVEFVVRKILNSNELVQLAFNQFGNYVLQKALYNLKGKRNKLYMELLSALGTHSKTLAQHINGRRVLKYMGELENPSL